VFVIRRDIVARSLARLRSQKTHTLFAGYLYLQKRAVELGRLTDLQPEFASFFKTFFLVGNAPLGTPYIKPFTEQHASTKNLWLNENVAGSYAPSSLRPDQPFRKVVSIEDGRYNLPPDHAQRAFQHLLYSNPVRVAEFTAFMYRDFGLLGDQPTAQDLVEIFAFEFGYTDSEGNKPEKNFDTLFTLDSLTTWDRDWLEAI
jgi:hypothetical protein